MLRVFGLAFALALTACGQGSATGTNQEAMQAWVGKSFAELKVQTLDGEVQPLKDLAAEGKPVVVNVWATWCPPCIKEMPTLDALGAKGEFNVIAIATDKDAGKVKDYLRKQAWGPGVTIWFDSLGAVTRKEMGAVALPVTYVLDKNLKVVLVEAGERDWSHSKMVAKIRNATK
ncbi:MAG: hypothetical protein DI585_02460 [Pseudomonas fluorescens]|nr:MAG: hypothetical protein DI585_02460 [Pseudomonas fluorescens]